jgi:hypothetical protein
MRASTFACHGLALGAGLLALSMPAAKAAADAASQEAEATPVTEVVAERLVHWEHFQELVGERAPDAEHGEAVLSPETFDGARPDLADLRLFDAAGSEVPYALQVRRPQDATEATVAQPFNVSLGPGQSSLLSLDLGEGRIEHNELEVELEGRNFRRRVLVEGSDDAESWRRVAEQDVLRFEVEGERLVAQTVRYGANRHRFLRLTVWPDPQVDQRPVQIGTVMVRRRVEVPGELVRHEPGVGGRQPVPAAGGPGSAWVLDLGGRDVPCSRLYVEVRDSELARDWMIEAAGRAEEGEPFRWVASGTWRRRAGEPMEPLVASFDEVRAARLLLVVTDHRNPPLEIQRVTSEAPARVVVFPARALDEGPLRLYFGNSRAEAPRYDFARILPPRLEPPPQRLELGPRQPNPLFQPEPRPFTERWPGLIYLLLGLAVAGLCLLILSLARATIAMADRRGSEGASASTG